MIANFQIRPFSFTFKLVAFLCLTLFLVSCESGCDDISPNLEIYIFNTTNKDSLYLTAENLGGSSGNVIVTQKAPNKNQKWKKEEYQGQGLANANTFYISVTKVNGNRRNTYYLTRTSNNGVKLIDTKYTTVNQQQQAMQLWRWNITSDQTISNSHSSLKYLTTDSNNNSGLAPLDNQISTTNPSFRTQVWQYYN